MKKPLILALAAVVILMTGACKQQETTDVDVEREGGVTVTETESTTMPTLDTAATAEATADVRDAAAEVGQETGTALEEAGRELQENTRTDTR